MCLKSDAPTISDSYVTVWSRDQATLSLTGNVACYADFVMAVGADATLRCRDVNGVALWAGYRNGDCRRRVFSGEHYSVRQYSLHNYRSWNVGGNIWTERVAGAVSVGGWVVGGGGGAGTGE